MVDRKIVKNVKNIIDGLAMHQNPESVAVLEDIGTNSKVDEIREMTVMNMGNYAHGNPNL